MDKARCIKIMVNSKEYYVIKIKKNHGNDYYKITDLEGIWQKGKQADIAWEYLKSKGIEVNTRRTYTLAEKIFKIETEEYYIVNPEIKKKVRKESVDESYKFDKHLSQELKLLRDLILESIFQFVPDFIAENLQFHDLGCPHQPELPPKGYSTVYLFKYKDEYLKVGKAGVNSAARVLSQHYYCKSRSSLAKSILKDERMQHLNLNADTVGDWIKKNCKRINIYIKDDDVFIYNYIEAMLQLKYQPRYEGKH